MGDVILVGVEVLEILRAVDVGAALGNLVVVVDEGVAHDGVQPRLQVGACLELLLVQQRLEQGFLHQVLGIVRVTS